MNLLTLLEESPPFFMYYMCGAGSKHPGLGTLAEKSGLSEATIIRLSNAITWKDVKIGTFDRFCKAVGEDFIMCDWTSGAVRGQRNYFIKPFKTYLTNLVRCNPRNPLRHLSTAQRNKFLKLWKQWKESRHGPF